MADQIEYTGRVIVDTTNMPTTKTARKNTTKDFAEKWAEMIKKVLQHEQSGEPWIKSPAYPQTNATCVGDDLRSVIAREGAIDIVARDLDVEVGRLWVLLDSDHDCHWAANDRGVVRSEMGLAGAKPSAAVERKLAGLAEDFAKDAEISKQRLTDLSGFALVVERWILDWKSAKACQDAQIKILLKVCKDKQIEVKLPLSAW